MPKARQQRALRRHLRLRCSHAPDAYLVNISINGCKVESRKTPRTGERVEFSADIHGRPTVLRGVVVHARDGLEFAVRFAGLDDDAIAGVRAVAAG